MITSRIGVVRVVEKVADAARHNGSHASFDQLAEEVMELHLALRGKSPNGDTPAMEWLEIATIAVNALRDLPHWEVDAAYRKWIERHASKDEVAPQA